MHTLSSQCVYLLTSDFFLILDDLLILIIQSLCNSELQLSSLEVELFCTVDIYANCFWVNRKSAEQQVDQYVIYSVFRALGR